MATAFASGTEENAEIVPRDEGSTWLHHGGL
ncbi:hypothetical protein SNOG_04239 [Parastagonospora nodorum SN15]|uniref:Uncharacterized protein n=1 Tax=Phaeosphaeria nodorum (strain SN15 / ATCC MYA-4574 / FGSC 10173) TaxID=321614 RepID=Q0UVH5_PHANO|nr:hypothetical protein SNOG_04239 [Parastagonospora nodorum SN15]EAT87999.1 hypothetical protein SNOG_04239 [Parastagonospora nodorum SN15]